MLSLEESIKLAQSINGDDVADGIVKFTSFYHDIENTIKAKDDEINKLKETTAKLASRVTAPVEEDEVKTEEDIEKEEAEETLKQIKENLNESI